MSRIITHSPVDPWDIVPPVRMEVTLHPAVLASQGINPQNLTYGRAATMVQHILHRAICDETEQVTLVRARILPQTPEEEIIPAVKEDTPPGPTQEEIEAKVASIRGAGLNKRLEEKMIQELIHG